MRKYRGLEPVTSQSVRSINWANSRNCISFYLTNSWCEGRRQFQFRHRSKFTSSIFYWLYKCGINEGSFRWWVGVLVRKTDRQSGWVLTTIGHLGLLSSRSHCSEGRWSDEFSYFGKSDGLVYGGHEVARSACKQQGKICAAMGILPGLAFSWEAELKMLAAKTLAELRKKKRFQWSSSEHLCVAAASGRIRVTSPGRDNFGTNT